MSTYRSHYTVTVDLSAEGGGDRYTANADLDRRYELPWVTRDAIATALEELAESLRSQDD